MKKYTRLLDSVVIFIGGFLAFSYGLFGRELVGFETRFGLFAKEMLQHGPSLFPTTYGLPYPDYPGLHTFLIYVISLVGGQVTTFTAILPTVLASALTLVLVYRLLASYDRTWAIAAVWLCLLTFQFLEAARTLAMDPLVMWVTMWAFYTVHQANTGRGLVCPLALILLLGFAIRGPIGLVIPAGVVCFAVWSRDSWRQAGRIGLWMALWFGILVILLGLAAYRVGQWDFVQQVLRMQILGRMSDQAHHYHSFAYFTDAFANYALSFELALLTMVCFAGAIVKASTPVWQLLRQCVLWLLVVLVGLSIPGVRKIRYIMPIVPALAVLASFWWYQPQLFKRRVLTWLHYGLLSMPFLGLLLTTAFIVVTHLKSLDVNAHYFSAYFLLALLALGSAYIAFNHPKAFALKHPLRVLALGAASFWVVLVFIIQPVNVSMNRVTPFVQQVLQQLPEHSQLAFYQMDRDSEAIQWMLAAPASFQPLFIENLAVSHSVWLLTTQNLFDQLPQASKDQFTVVQTGYLGHRPMVVFRWKEA